jgi:tetratricopeptide (TPR) repeat protein
LAVAAYENVAGAWAKDADVLTEVRYKLALALLERAKAEASTDANATRVEARNVLLHTLSALKTVKNSSEFTYGTSGRVWLSRSILLLGQLYEDEGDTLEAIATYRIITELNRLLPQGEIRLPGQNAAESKLATLSQISNKK